MCVFPCLSVSRAKSYRRNQTNRSDNGHLTKGMFKELRRIERWKTEMGTDEKSIDKRTWRGESRASSHYRQNKLCGSGPGGESTPENNSSEVLHVCYWSWSMSLREMIVSSCLYEGMVVLHSCSEFRMRQPKVGLALLMNLSVKGIWISLYRTGCTYVWLFFCSIGFHFLINRYIF